MIMKANWIKLKGIPDEIYWDGPVWVQDFDGNVEFKNVDEFIPLNRYEFWMPIEVPKPLVKNKGLKTSKEWLKDVGYEIVDPKGWDKENLNYSFNIEKITEAEFLLRLRLSVTRRKLKCNKVHINIIIY